MNSDEVKINPSKLRMLPLGCVKPEGWLKKQLEIQAQGLTGHLEELWPDVGENSGWLGKDGEQWERGPYYCDGLVALAWLLDDDKLKAKAKKWMEWSIESQTSDGFFGPEGNRDWWPRFVMLKALAAYGEATKDERVYQMMERYFDYRLQHCDDKPVTDWGKARSADEILSMFWLSDATGSEKAALLAQKIAQQGTDWTSMFNDFPFKKQTSEYMDWPSMAAKSLSLIEKQEQTPYFETHVVNVAMGIKHPAVMARLGRANCEEALKKGLKTLEECHGVATGMFNGDEHLNGASPSQGTELCAVGEMMFSLEKTIEIFGVSYADLLEKIAFNAFPATISPEYTSHQYLQQVNQVRATREKRSWYNNDDDSVVFGLEPNFGCCTANMHQGWPRFVQSLWMEDNGGNLKCVSYAPCKVNTNGINFTVETAYPFREEIIIKVAQNDNRKNLLLRVPAWCESPAADMNGVNLELANNCYTICPSQGSVITLKFKANARRSNWHNNSCAVEWGPLLMALPLEYEKSVLQERGRFSDIELRSNDEWRYALNKQEDDVIHFAPMPDVPFKHGEWPVSITVSAKQCKNWNMEGASAAQPPENPECGQECRIKLVPYGSTGLRIGQFPVCK